MSSPRPAARARDDKRLPGLSVCLLHVPDCPLVEQLRAILQKALESLGETAVVEELEGSYRSPALLVGGMDVTGEPLGVGPACRLDLPTIEQVAAALLAARRERAGLVRTQGASA